MTIAEKINAVVDAREAVREATAVRMAAYQKWLEENQSLCDAERIARDTCQEAENGLRKEALIVYGETGNKAVAPGVGIRVMQRFDYEHEKASAWAMEHKLSLKLDTASFEKIAKINSLPFVTITAEPQATIKEKWGAESAKDLTIPQASALIEMIQKGEVVRFEQAKNNIDGLWFPELKPDDATTSTEAGNTPPEGEQGTVRDVSWAIEGITELQKREVDGWDNNNIASYLKTLTKKPVSKISISLTQLTDEQYARFCDSIKDALPVVK